MSYCQKGMFLESGKGLAITLHPGECNPAPPLPPSSSPALTNNLVHNNQTPFPSRQPLDSAVSFNRKQIILSKLDLKI
jgi:hypothetical protein